MGWFRLFVVHAAASLAVSQIAMFTGPGFGDKVAGHAALLFLVVQIIFAIAIIWRAPPGRRIVAGIVGLLAVAWALACSMVVSMGLNGIWL